MAFCTECGETISGEALACPKCGKPQHHNIAKVEGKDKVTAGILALFLGGIGIHKFYLGKKGMGILYLVFCWTFIPSIVALIEGIILLCMSDSDFNAKYNQ